MVIPGVSTLLIPAVSKVAYSGLRTGLRAASLLAMASV